MVKYQAVNCISLSSKGELFLNGTSGENIYHVGLYFGAQHSSLNGDAKLVKNKALLDFTKLSNGEVSLRHGWNGESLGSA